MLGAPRIAVAVHAPQLGQGYASQGHEEHRAVLLDDDCVPGVWSSWKRIHCQALDRGVDEPT